MTILQVCAYAAPYPGNFIASLKLLGEKLKNQGHSTVYAFPETAKDKEWCKELSKSYEVYYLPVAKARILPKTYMILNKIYKENNIFITHSHFGLYDIPSTVTAPKDTNIFWHLHDAIRQSEKKSRNILNQLQYGFFSKKSNLISVSEYYRKKVVEMGFEESRTYSVLNGIDLSRIVDCTGIDKHYEFVTFGWDFHRKGSDIIFQAMDKLQKEGYSVKLLYVGINETRIKVNEYFKGLIPDWLEYSDTVADINILFKQAQLFIQASRKETFSYAVCEAAYAGLPVIASNIPGLEWSENVPVVSLFENENVDELYRLMKQHITNNNSISENKIGVSRNVIKENYSLEVWVKNIIDVYKYAE